MNAELQVAAGSRLQRLGYLTEAEGDQPGSIAALRRDVVAMGFEPLVLGNVKGFLNRTPTLPEMEKWAALQGISVEQVTSFTDGTKVHIEQVVVANGLDADLAPGGMVGGDTVHDGFKEGAYALAEIAERAGIVMSDFLMASNTPSPGRDRPTPGVFIVATMPDARQRPSLKYYKLGEGPYYFFERPFHLCHFELPKTIRAVVDGDAPLLNNGARPRYGVAAVAKRDLARGETIARGVGGFDVRGEGVAVADAPDHVPVALLAGARLRREVRAGETLRFDDVGLPESEALEAWLGTVEPQRRGAPAGPAPEPRTIDAA
jgi:predicted homoserine dehydrogenase-like protein